MQFFNQKSAFPQMLDLSLTKMNERKQGVKGKEKIK